MSETQLSIEPQSKHYKMKQLVNAIHLYFQTQREDTAVIINMHLQSLSATLDLSVFDPHSSIVPQFFVSLCELMNKMEVRSAFAWNCVDVLANACRNPSARRALIHTYQFVPSLSRLLSDQLASEKKVRLLRLMQDLTCGIKISWQIPHLPHLMLTLSDWIEHSNEDIVTLSMGILVNLCYKNLPAIYTLMGNVDVKRILEICAAMRGPTIEIHTCKLLIILDNTNNSISRNILEKMVSVTFESVIEAFRIRDSILLRQIVEFFIDIGKHNSLEFLKNGYSEKVKPLLAIIQNNCTMETGDGNFENRDPECIAIIFEFLNFLTEIRANAIITSFPVIIHEALKWIHTDLVSSQALALLTSIAINVDPNFKDILEPLIQGLPLFLSILDYSRNEDGPDYVEQNLNISRLLQLLKIMVQVPTVRPKVVEELKIETICKIFGTLEDIDEGNVTSNNLDMGNIDTINLYIHGVALVNELAKHDMSWMKLQSNLMQHKQTHMILAQCLCQSAKEEKAIVLEMSAVPCFPQKAVAEIMVSLQAVAPDLKRSVADIQDLNFPVLSVTQLKKVDGLLSKLQELHDHKQLSSVLTSDVIELYEYKLVSMGNAERAAMASVQAASERCIYLQHRNAQLTAELNRSHQMLHHVQQCHEKVTKIKDNLAETLEGSKKQSEKDRSQLKAVNRQLEEELGRVKEELEDVMKRHERIAEGKKQLEEQNIKLKQLVTKLEETVTKLEKVVQKKEEALKKACHTTESQILKINELESCLTQKHAELQQTMTELKDVTRELNTRKQILDTITKVALNSQIMEQ